MKIKIGKRRLLDRGEERREVSVSGETQITTVQSSVRRWCKSNCHSFTTQARGLFRCRTTRENTPSSAGLAVRVNYPACDCTLLARSLLWALPIRQQAKTFRLAGCVILNTTYPPERKANISRQIPPNLLPILSQRRNLHFSLIGNYTHF